MSTKTKQFRKRARDSDDEEDDSTNRNKVGVSTLSSLPSSSSSSSSSKQLLPFSSSTTTTPSIISSSSTSSSSTVGPSLKSSISHGVSVTNTTATTLESSINRSSLANTDKKGITSFSTSSSSSSSSSSNNEGNEKSNLLSDTNDAEISGGSIAYTSSGTGTAYQYGGGAFSYSEINTSEAQDARANLEKKLSLQSKAISDIEQGKRIYRGLVGYTNFQQQKGTAEEIISQAKIAGTIGPVRAPTNVRGICRIDYQPDVCKDYKETGQCSFGDSCIYLHDRSDYKSGWQIEVEWQKKQKRKADKLAERLAQGQSIENISDSSEDEKDKETIKQSKRVSSSFGSTTSTEDTTGVHLARQWKVGLGNSKYNKNYQPNSVTGDPKKKDTTNPKNDDENDLPFACYICRQPFTSPVQTQCGHYFCELCAIQRHRNFPLCAVCGKPTLGIFNAAPKLEARLKELVDHKNSHGGDNAKDNNERTTTSNTIGWATVVEDSERDNDATPSSPVGDSDASTDKELGVTSSLSSSSSNVPHHRRHSNSHTGEGEGGWSTVE